jgi:hypothetical protein
MMRMHSHQPSASRATGALAGKCLPPTSQVIHRLFIERQEWDPSEVFGHRTKENLGESGREACNAETLSLGQESETELRAISYY